MLGRDGVSREMMGRDLYIYCISLPVVLAALWGSGLSSPPSIPLLAIWQVGGFPAMLRARACKHREAESISAAKEY